LGNWSVSGLIQASHVKLPVVGMENAGEEAILRYSLDPLKSTARSPFGMPVVGG
jgi:hypothetical protein